MSSHEISCRGEKKFYFFAEGGKNLMEPINLYQLNTNRHADRFKVRSRTIQDVLLTIGMPPNLLGYNYILSALNMILVKPEYLHCITKGLYSDIASQHDSTPSRVERAMRHAISATWLNGNMEYINYIFRNCVNPQKGTPSNSLFLARMYYFLK